MKKFNKLFSNNVVFTTVLFVCIFTVKSSLSMFPQIVESSNTLQKQEQVLDAQISQAKAILSVIQDPIRKSEGAREQFHLSADGEIIFVFPEVKSD
ncbi:MAG: septum formation initiator family protein [Mycoplasmatales bacterium]